MKNVFFFFTFCVKLKVQNTPTPKRAQVLEEIWRTKTKARLVVFKGSRPISFHVWRLGCEATAWLCGEFVVCCFDL